MHTATPRVITVDTNAAYPLACETLQEEGLMPYRSADLQDAEAMPMRRKAQGTGSAQGDALAPHQGMAPLGGLVASAPLVGTLSNQDRW
jgi:hypothetical protein